MKEKKRGAKQAGWAISTPPGAAVALQRNSRWEIGLGRVHEKKRAGELGSAETKKKKKKKSPPPGAKIFSG